MLEPVDQQYVKIGHIAQAHGVEGNVLIIPEYYAPELFDDIDLVRLQDARGDLIPARVESVRVQQKNNRLSFFVKFDHITDRNQAETLKDYPVYVSESKVQHLLEDDTETRLISFEVVDGNDETVGTVDKIIPNPAQIILQVETETQELLIPFVDEYIREIDEEKAIIYCQNLHQLMDLS